MPNVPMGQNPTANWKSCNEKHNFVKPNRKVSLSLQSLSPFNKPKKNYVVYYVYIIYINI